MIYTVTHFTHRNIPDQSFIIKKEKISVMLSIPIIVKEMCKRVSYDISSFSGVL